VVHEELERAAHIGLEAFVRSLPSRTAAWRRRLGELGVGEDSQEAAVVRVGRALRATVEDERGRWLFDPRHRSAASELDLTSTRGGIIAAARIDRTFVDESGVRWIVDFKTSEHEGRDLDGFLDQERARYEPQLERYAELIARRDPGKPIRLGLYFPLHSGWREWARAERAAAADGGVDQ
jgi:ATP-dependent helicase/nuclease subunit A